MTDEIERYDEVTCIVDGALSEIILVSDGDIFESEYGTADSYVGTPFTEWLQNLSREAIRCKFVAHVYVLSHGHPPYAEECTCNQYETDHNPVWTYGEDDNDDSE